MTERAKPRWPRIADALRLQAPAVPQEILAAVFSAACEAGLSNDQALLTLATVAETFDGDLAAEIRERTVRLMLSTDRQRSYSTATKTAKSPLVRELLMVLASAEISGEEVVTRSRQLFENLSAKRDAAVQKRAETYPLIMIVIMVLFFIPALVVMLVGPLYIRLMQVLHSI